MEEKKNKVMLIASFTPKSTLEWFQNYVYDKFEIKKEEIFVYNVEGNDSEYLLTFKIKNDKRVDFKQHFSNATIVNVKNGCIFSINGLNKLIELESGTETGNLIYKNYVIDWSNYKDTLILCNKNALTIKKIKRKTEK